MQILSPARTFRQTPLPVSRLCGDRIRLGAWSGLHGRRRRRCTPLRLARGVWKSTDGGLHWSQSSFRLKFGIAAGNAGGQSPDNGPAAGGRTYLVFDGSDSKYTDRLLYATIDNDGRTSHALGGLWASNDAAKSWDHVALAGTDPACPSTTALDITSVTFLQTIGTPDFPGPHLPLVMTACGIFTTGDPSLMSGWRLLKPGKPLPFGDGALLATDSVETIFACQGTSVWESMDDGQSWIPNQAPQMGTLGCVGLAADPVNGAKQQDASRSVLETTAFAKCPTSGPQPATCNYEVSVVKFANDGVPSDDRRRLLGFPNDVSPGTGITKHSSGCCGQTVLAAFQRGSSESDAPGFTYDVFASDQYRFWVYTNVGGSAPSWRPVDKSIPIHGDTWAVAAALHYDPDAGDCTVWLGNDGGVYLNGYSTPFNTTSSPNSCPLDGSYLLAEHGLHVLTSTSLSGQSIDNQQLCPNSQDPCPALYVSSADNETWGITPLHSPSGDWGPFCGLGDAGSTFVTPAVRDQLITGREPAPTHLLLYQDFPLPDPGNLSHCPSGATNISPPGSYFGGNEPPGNAGFTVVGDPRTATNYYVGVDAESPPLSGLTVRVKSDSSDSGWRVVNSGLFDCCDKNNGDQIAAVKAGRAGDNLVIYVLTKYDGGCCDANGKQFVGGHVYRGAIPLRDVGTNFNMPLSDVSGDPKKTHLDFAADLFVNPYDPDNAYSFDRNASQATAPSIKLTFDGGQTWQNSGALLDVATQYGTFTSACNVGVGLTVDPLANGCTLRNMYFDNNNPDIQVAVLQPGGIALSNDHGQEWVDLDVTDVGVSFFDQSDPEPLQIATGAFYDESLNPRTGHPSLYLGLGGAGVHRIDGPLDTLGAVTFSIICPACISVFAFDDIHHLIVGLRESADGTFHATQLFDLRGTSTYQFHFVIDGTATDEQTIKITQPKSGEVISIQQTCDSDEHGHHKCKRSGPRGRHHFRR
jgi:hypothetical protein